MAQTLGEYLVKIGAQIDGKGLDEVVSRLDSIDESGKQANATLREIADNMKGMSAAAGNASKSVSVIQTIFKGLSTVARTAGKAVSFVANGIKGIWDTAHKAQDKAKQSGLFDSIDGLFKSLFKFNLINKLSQKLSSTITGGLASIGKAFMKAAGPVKEFTDYCNKQFSSMMTTVGRQVAKELSGPIKEFGVWFKSIKKDLTSNLNGLAQKAGHYIATFVKGLGGIQKVGTKVIDWFKGLPNSIRGAATAVMALWAVMKAGPIGQLMMLVTAVGGLIDDYQNYQYNKTANPADQVEVAFPSIWELIDQGDDADGSVAEKVMGKVAEKFGEMTINFSGWVEEHKGDIIEAAHTAMDFVTKAFSDGSSLIASIAEIFQTIGKDPAFIKAVDGIKDSFAEIFSGLWDTVSPYLDLFGLEFQSWLFSLVDGTTLGDFMEFLGIKGTIDPMDTFVTTAEGDVTTLNNMKESGASIVERADAIRRGKEDEQSVFLNDMRARGYMFDNGAFDFGNRNSTWNAAADAANQAFTSGDMEKFKSIVSVMDNYAANAQRMQQWAGNDQGVWATDADYVASANQLAGIAEIASGGEAIEQAAAASQQAADTNQQAAATQAQAALTYEAAAAAVMAAGGDFAAAANSLSVLPDQLRAALNSGPKKAWGGRLGSAQHVLAGEDGPEYIIPVTKPARAISLIKSMFMEMGGSTVSQVMQGLGLGGDRSTIGGNLIAGGSVASGGVTINNYNNISAPVNITVHGDGASGREIGRTAYSAAQHSLIRTLSEVVS